MAWLYCWTCSPFPLHLQMTAIRSALHHPGLTDLTWQGHSTTKRHNVSHRAYWSDLLDRFDASPSTDSLRSVNPLPGLRIIRASFSGLTKFCHPSQITIYTDGSKIDDHVGAGYVIYKGSTEYDTGSYSLSPQATVFQAELVAILLAARHVLNEARSLRPRYVKFLSDSRSALLALNIAS